jgi:hypothetical protein
MKPANSANEDDKEFIEFVCPGCFVSYEFCKSELNGLNGSVPTCDYCNLALVRCEKVLDMKCWDCLCGIESPDGIWCIRFKGIPTKAMAERCREYVNRRVVYE